MCDDSCCFVLSCCITESVAKAGERRVLGKKAKRRKLKGVQDVGASFHNQPVSLRVHFTFLQSELEEALQRSKDGTLGQKGSVELRVPAGR